MIPINTYPYFVPFCTVDTSSKKYEGDFIQFFKDQCDKRDGKNRSNCLYALHYLRSFAGQALKSREITANFCNDYRDLLLKAKAKDGKQISQNTAELYFTKFRASVRKAYDTGNLEAPVADKVVNIKKAETRRNYLSLPELNKLVQEECKMPILKSAALFSALTGLRFSDIEKMTWSEIQAEGALYYIHFKQKKTRGWKCCLFLSMRTTY